MIITGIADEGAADIQEQIKIHQELGWTSIELRLIGDSNICAVDDAVFDQVCERLAAAEMEVVCFSSPLANWARPITADFTQDIDDLKRSAPRMRRLNTRYMRIMSYPNDDLTEQAWKKEAIRRVAELARIADGEGVVLVHENCSGWGGQSPDNQRILLETVDSPALKIVFDTGNPVGEGHPPEETWAFYQTAKPYIEHIHIKDCARDPSGEILYTYPGEGESMVERIIKDALDGGYTGAFAIEPHIAVQIHLSNAPGAGADAREIYLEYGRRTNALFKALQ